MQSNVKFIKLNKTGSIQLFNSLLILSIVTAHIQAICNQTSHRMTAYFGHFIKFLNISGILPYLDGTLPYRLWSNVISCK